MGAFTSPIIIFFLFLLHSPQTSGSKSSSERNHGDGSVIGALVDRNSREGKEACVAMEIAVADINRRYTNQTLDLHIKDTRSSPLEAALQARDLMNKHQGLMKSILGYSHRWEEVSLLAEISSKAQIPLVSLADSTPEWATKKWPFLIQASPNQSLQMKALAAIIQSWEWRQVTVLYEDMASASSEALSSLSDVLKQVNVEIKNFLALPPVDSSSSLADELQRLKTEQCRVFVVHASMPVAASLFRTAKKMKMMEKDYVWIVTDLIANHLDSLDASTISSMQGVLGIKNYFPENGHHFRNFYTKFRIKFSNKHPEEQNHEPGHFAAQAYDVTMLVASSLRENSSPKGKLFLERISAANFNGLSGKMRFRERKLASKHTLFQIVNVIGKSYRELGFWSERSGFVQHNGDEKASFSSSMVNLGQVIWPGGRGHTPRGWSPIATAKPLRVGVPNMKSTFKEFVNVVYDHQTNRTSYTGFAIEVFEEMMNRLPYNLPYEFSPFNGTYSDLVKQVHLEKFDAVAGDVAIIEKRLDYAAFSHPYSQEGLVMIVPVQPQLCNKPWLFIKPFTKPMWVLILVVNIYNGFAIWLIERNHHTELRGSAVNQVGVLLWLTFNTLFALHVEKLHSNLSRMVTVVWLLVTLILAQSYTASLTSMLTVQRLVPTIANVEALKKDNAVVGYGRGSYVGKYLEEQLKLSPKNIKNFDSLEDYVQAFKTRKISAAFLEGPYAKVFLAKYCKSFIKAGPTYKVGAFGFVFPKGSLMLPDVNKALLNMMESGTLRNLENEMTGGEVCVDEEVRDETSLGPKSFSVLFGFTGGISTIALTVCVIAGNYKAVVVDLWRQWTFVIRKRSIGNVGNSRNNGIPRIDTGSSQV